MLQILKLEIIHLLTVARYFEFYFNNLEIRISSWTEVTDLCI